jgi:hypothetical protein
MSAVRQPFQGDYIEANHAGAPLCLSLQEESSGANDFALLAPVHRRQGAAEIDANSLPHFNDREHAAVQAYQIEFPGSAPHIAREHDETSRLQIFRRESF